MAEYIKLPDGSFLELKEGQSALEGRMAAQQLYPELFKTASETPKRDTTGFKAAAAAGFERLGGEFELLKGKTGLKSEAEAQKEYEAAQKRAQERFTPTEKGWAEAPFLKFRETLGGSVPYMAAPAAAGLAALAAPVAAPTAAALGLLGAGAVSTGQFTGSNLARQVEEGKTLEEASGAAALGAAIPQALIDTAAMALLPGVGKLFGSVGSKLTTEQAKAIASQTLSKTAMDYTAKTGMAMGREGLTEVVQQSLERLQAGLNIADPDAREEYIESFIGGAVLGGAIAPVGRAIERSGAKTQAARAERDERNVAAKEAAEQERVAEEQARVAAEQEEAKRQTPEYATEVGQQYDALLQEFQTKQTALKKPGKDATPVEKAEYKDAQKELQDLNAQLKEIVPEYRRTAPIRARAEQEQAAAAEQARTAGMSPMEYMVDQTPEVADTPFTPAEPDLAGYAMPEPVIRKYAAPPAVYAQERLQLAQEQAVEPDAKTYADYLLQDVGMARAVLDDSDVELPKGVRKELAKAVPAQEAALRLQDAAARKQSTAASQQRIAGVEEEEQAALEAQRAEGQRAAEEAQREQALGGEFAALQRMRAAPAGRVRPDDALPSQVDQLVESVRTSRPSSAPAGRLVSGTSATEPNAADMLRAQLAYASATENKPLAAELKKQLADLNEPDTERAAGDIEFGLAAKEAGVEGRLTRDAMQANRVTRLSNTQLGAYDRLADFVQRVRESDQDVSDERKQTLLTAAEKLKDDVIGLALNEVDARRVQAGLPELGVPEKTKIVGQLSQTLGELVERGAGIFQKPVEQKAQMRGSRIVMGAGEDTQQPLGRRVFNNYNAASQALREQMRSDIDTLGGFTPTEASQQRPERKPQRVIPLLKPQRPGFSDREIGQQFVAAYDRAESDADYRTLKDIESKFSKLSEAAQDEATIQVRRVENGMPLEIRGTLKDELADLRAAGVSDTGQAELFPGDTEKSSTRTTPKRFLAFLDSQKVQGLRAKLAEENRVLAFQEKRAATIAKKLEEEAAKAAAAEQKILASNARSPVQKAKAALDRLVGPESKVTQALQISDQVKAQRETSRGRLRAMLSQIEDAEQRAKKQVADIQELFNFTVNKLAEVSADSATGTAPSMNELAMWTQARDNQASELKKAQKTLNAVQKSLKAAQATQLRVIEDHAKDTIGNALINEGEKAQRKYERAKAALEKAEAQESAALRLLKAEQKKPAPVTKTTEEQVLERLGPDARVENVERVYRDTSDANVQAKVTAERKTIAAAEEAHDRAKEKGDKLGMENALRRIEAAYDRIYTALNNAPLRREVQMSDAEAKQQEAFDQAQADAFEANIKLFEEAAGLRPLKMTERRTIASVRNVKSNRIVPQFKEESVAAQEARVKKEEATGVYPAKALEELAKARAARAEVQRQIDYIDANPAAPRSDAKKRQTAARTAAVAKRKTLDEQIKTLGAAQKEVVAEAKLDTQAEKALRRERAKMVRSAGRLQEAIDDTDADLLFSRGVPVQGLSADDLRSELLRAVGDEDTYAKKVSVFDSVQDFLRTHKQYAGKIPTDAKGFVDPKSGRAYLFAENIAKGEGLGILLHEVGVHLGFRNFFNAGQFNAIAKTVRNWANAPANTLEGKIGRAAAKRAKDAGTSAAQMDDELIAYAVEEAVKAGVEPAGVKGGSAVQNWLRMIVNAFNKALETLGLAPEKLKVGDLVNMAYGAAQLEIKGTWHGTGKLFKEFDHKYMGTGEGAQAFSWGTYRADTTGVASVYQSLGARKQDKAWAQQPEVAAWRKTQAPKLDGKTAEDFDKFAKNGKPGDVLAGVPHEMANAVSKTLERLANDLAAGTTISAPRADFEGNFRFPYANALEGITENALKQWAKTADFSKITAPYNEPLYKGFDETDIYGKDSGVGEAERRAVSDVLSLMAAQPDLPVQEALQQAIEEKQKYTDLLPSYIPTLAALKKLNAEDFSFNRPTPPPLPRPTGVMLRTLHGRKESDYLQWDLPWTAQPKNISDAFFKAINSLPKKQQMFYNDYVSRAKRTLKGRDVYEALGAAMESDKDASELLFKYGVAGTKFLDRESRKKPITDESTFNYVDYSDKDAGAAILGADINPVGPAEGLLFSRGAPADALESLSKKIIAQPKTLKEKLGSNLALQAEMQAVDMRAGLRDVLKFGDDKLFTQAMYHVRKAEQKMAQMFTVMNSGPLVAYKDEKGLVGYRSSNQNSAREVFDAISDIPVDNPQLKTDLAQTYLVAVRANNKGLPKLDLGAMELKQADLDAALAAAEANPALKSALENVRRKYSAYNKGMIEFLASTGRISKKEAADLLKEGDYVPFYRVDKNGKADLVFNNNVTFKVGDIRHQPYLAELKGGDTKLLPLNEAIQRNTLLLTDMALTNNAAKSVAYGLQALGKGKGPVDPKTGKPTNLMAIKPGFGPDDAKVIRFHQEPDPRDPEDDGKRHIVVDTKGTLAEGIPAELVVQSLEGASLALPGFMQLGGVAADWLRAGVTRTPLYIARKLIREPMAASFTGGLESNAFSSVFKAGAEFLRMSAGSSDAQAKLIEKGLIQSNIFAGDMSDMKKMALQLASGKDQSVWEKVFAAADRYAMRADAATLALVLKNAEASGLSEVEADMATMESMNFYKRGLSPTLQYASRLIPFFNAQIQGLNVLVKAARGNMPFEEQQEIKRKFFNNALLLTFTGVAYAMAMEDDETFRNARPRDKYSNFFMPIPGVDEPLKLPIPFEAGYFFSLAVAAVDSMRAETDGKAQWQAIRDLFLGSIPGYSSMGIPQIAKPVAEVWSNKNFLTGGAVESLRLQGLDTEERYLATTTELAKQMSKAVPLLSPIQIEHLVRGYFGVMPLAAVAAANNLFEREGKGEKPAGRASDLPLVGTAFQKKYGGADADVVFREADEAMTARSTLNKMLSEGRREEAAEYRDKHLVELAMAPAAGQYRQVIGRINADVRRTQERNDLTPEEKRLRLDELDKARQGRAEAFLKLQQTIETRQGKD